MSSDVKSDFNVKGWFDAHCLPWSDAIAKTLNDQGVKFVEDLEILNRAVLNHLFMDKKPIVKTSADIAWKQLGGCETFQFQKVVPSIPIKNASNPLTKKYPKTKPSLHAIKPNGGNSLLRFSGFTRNIIITAKEKGKERDQRKRSKKEESTSIVDAGNAKNSTTSPHFPPKPTTVPNIVAPILTLPPSDYRVDRCFLSETLSDSAGELENIFGDRKLSLKKLIFMTLKTRKDTT